MPLKLLLELCRNKGEAKVNRLHDVKYIPPSFMFMCVYACEEAINYRGCRICENPPEQTSGETKALKKKICPYECIWHVCLCNESKSNVCSSNYPDGSGTAHSTPISLYQSAHSPTHNPITSKLSR